MEILDMTAVELGGRIRKREISAAEALEAVYGACRERDRNWNAYTDFEIDPARTAAQHAQTMLDNGETGSALTGVPVGIKDNISVRNCLTTCASKILRGYRAPFDATAVQNCGTPEPSPPERSIWTNLLWVRLRKRPATAPSATRGIPDTFPAVRRAARRRLSRHGNVFARWVRIRAEA